MRKATKEKQEFCNLVNQTQGDLFQHNIKICLKCVLLIIRSYIKYKDENIVDYVPTKLGIRRPAQDQFVEPHSRQIVPGITWCKIPWD